MALSCDLCGKTAIGGFNPQSSGMNRVRAHRRMTANLQPMKLEQKGVMRRVLVCTRCQRTMQKTA